MRGDGDGFVVSDSGTAYWGRHGAAGLLRMSRVLTDMIATDLARVEGLAVLSNSRLLELMRTGVLDPSPLVTHHMSLADAPQAYEVYDRREALKIVMKP